MAAQQFVVFLLSQMQAVTFAVFEGFAIGTDAGFCPRAVAHNLVAVIPNIPKIVLVNVSLNIVGTQTGAGADRPVHQNRTNVDSGAAEKRRIADFKLVVAEKTLATVRCFDNSLFSCLFDKI